MALLECSTKESPSHQVFVFLERCSLLPFLFTSHKLSHIAFFLNITVREGAYDSYFRTSAKFKPRSPCVKEEENNPQRNDFDRKSVCSEFGRGNKFGGKRNCEQPIEFRIFHSGNGSDIISRRKLDSAKLGNSISDQRRFTPGCKQ